MRTCWESYTRYMYQEKVNKTQVTVPTFPGELHKNLVTSVDLQLVVQWRWVSHYAVSYYIITSDTATPGGVLDAKIIRGTHTLSFIHVK